MGLKHRFGYWVQQLNRTRAKRDLELEIQAHLEMETQDNVERGMSPVEARLKAKRAFGSVTLAADNSYDMSGFGAFDRLVQDLKNAVRILRRSRGFAVVATLSLALGIGANTAIFSMMDVVSMRVLPVEAPEELATIGDPSALGSRRQGSWAGEVHSYPIYQRFRERTKDVFAGLFAAGSPGRIDVSMDGSDLHSQLGSIRARIVTGKT